MHPRRLVIGLLLSLFLYPSSMAAEPSTSASAAWEQAQRRAQNLHRESSASLAEWVEQVDRPAQDLEQAMFKVAVLLKAGVSEATVVALRELKTFAPTWDPDWVRQLYGTTCRDLRLSQAVAEIFVESSGDVPLWRCTARSFAEAGWSLEQVDEWLAAQEELGGVAWSRNRLLYNIFFGRDVPWVRSFFLERFGPDDSETAHALIRFVNYHSRNGWPNESEHLPLMWLAEDLAPRSAQAALELGSLLLSWDDAEEARILFLKALEIPLDEAEILELAGSAPFISEEARRKAAQRQFDYSVQEKLSRSFLKSGNAEESRRWWEKAAETIGSPVYGSLTHLAGRIQAASEGGGADSRFAPGEVPQSAHDWWLRSIYFDGLGDARRQEEALRQGLEMARDEGPDAVFHSSVYLGLLHFLDQARRGDEVAEILRSDLRAQPPQSKLAVRAATLWAEQFRDTIGPGEPVLWQWLSSFSQWQADHWSVLRALVMASEGEGLAQEVERARRLVAPRGSQALLELGLTLSRLPRTESAIPVLEEALAQELEEAEKAQGQNALYYAYLHNDHWRSAYALYPQIFGTDEKPHRPNDLGAMAVDAAEEGQCAESREIWHQVLTIDPNQTAHLKELARRGLGTALRQLYHEMQETLPGSSAPAEALSILESVQPGRGRACGLEASQSE